MSLLLDALKEAEARKRDATPARAVPARAEESSFETVGTLALAEDTAPELTVDSAPAPLLAVPPRAAPSPVEQLRAARTARAATAPAAPLSASPAPTASFKAAAADLLPQPVGRAGVATAAAAPAGLAPVRTRAELPSLLGIAGLLALLVCGAVFYNVQVSGSPPVQAVPTLYASQTAAPAASSAPASFAPPPALPLPPASAISQPSVPTPASATALVARPAPYPQRESDSEPTGDAEGDPASGERIPQPRSDSPDRNPRISISREAAPLDAAWAAQQAGNLDRAKSFYLRVLSAEPGQVDAQLGLAVIAHARGDDAAARRGYRQVLESVPDHPRAWAGLAELAGDGEAAPIESRLRQLLADRPSAPLHFALGNVLARQERWADAQQSYFAAASLEPDAADYAYNVAVALDRLGKSAAASPWYRRALDQAATGRAVRFDATAARARLELLQAASP